jgi:hypothetical protein
MFMFLYFSRAIAAISARSSLPLFGASIKAAVAPTTAPPKRASSILVPFVIVGLGLKVSEHAFLILPKAKSMPKRTDLFYLFAYIKKNLYLCS